MSGAPLPDDPKTPVMDPAVKARWLAALRGGQYKQTRGVLHKAGEGMCCLGVLCDLLEPDRWMQMVADCNVRQHDGQTHFPSVELLIRIKLPQDVARKTLSVMNDGDEADNIQPHSFAQVADWIEANL